jgi:hypothetical protein
MAKISVYQICRVTHLGKITRFLPASGKEIVKGVGKSTRGGAFSGTHKTGEASKYQRTQEPDGNRLKAGGGSAQAILTISRFRGLNSGDNQRIGPFFDCREAACHAKIVECRYILKLIGMQDARVDRPNDDWLSIIFCRLVSH